MKRISHLTWGYQPRLPTSRGTGVAAGQGGATTAPHRPTGGCRAVFVPRGEVGLVAGAGWGGSIAAAPRRDQGRPAPASRCHLVVAGHPCRCLPPGPSQHSRAPVAYRPGSQTLTAAGHSRGERVRFFSFSFSALAVRPCDGTAAEWSWRPLVGAGEWDRRVPASAVVTLPGLREGPEHGRAGFRRRQATLERKERAGEGRIARGKERRAAVRGR